MVTYGFYNSINHDRVYDATQMSEIFDGIIRDGVYQYVGNKFLVDINGLEGFQVRVGTGRAWFNHTWTKNDAPLILTLPAPPTLDNYYRADAIVIDINANVNVRENKITYVKGTEVADNPSPPYPELLDGEHKQVALAYIVRKGAETEINAANINYVVGSNPCPYVTAPVQAVDLSAHVAQWQAAWNQWFNTKTAGWDEALAAAEADIAAATSSVNTHANNAKTTINEYVAEFQVWIASQKSQFTGWMSSSKEDFDTWFANLHYILDGDVAGHLQNEIDDINTAIIPIERGGTGNTAGYIRTGYKNTSGNTIGDFATAEGMNTIASGEGAHAEGGGNYTVSQPVSESGMYGPSSMYTLTKTYDNVWRDSLYDPKQIDGAELGWQTYTGTLEVCYGDAVTRQAFSNRSWIPTTSDQEQNGMRHCYLGIILRNTNTNEILFHSVICCGPDDQDNPNFLTGATIQKSERQKTGYVRITEGTSNGYLSNVFPYEEFATGASLFVLYKNEDIALCLGDWRYTTSSSNEGEFKMNASYGIPSGVTDDNNAMYYKVPNLDLYNIAVNDGRTVDVSMYQVEVYFTGDGIIEYLEAGETRVTITGEGPKASGKFSHVEGENTLASGINAHAEGHDTMARGNYSHAEGLNYSTKVDRAQWPAASGIASHTEGYATEASGNYAHAEGTNTIASGNGSHASGNESIASGDYSVAIGAFTEAHGDFSFAGGYETKSYDDAQFVYGYDANRQGISDDLKFIKTSLFGLPGEPRYKDASYSEYENLSSIEEMNELLERNRNGLSICLKCPTTKNSLEYRTALPKNILGTYLELIDLFDGSPTNDLVQTSARILKITPDGLFDAIKLNTSTYGSDLNTLSNIVVISGGQYIYQTNLGTQITLTNRLDATVSTNSVSRYIKYVLIRLF